MARPGTLYRMTPPSTALIVPARGTPRPLPHIRYHSPEGFAWGYGGSGPADLALSLLRHHLGELPGGASPWYGAKGYWRQRVEQTRAFALHREFLALVVQPKVRDAPWDITGEQIETWLKAITPYKEAF